MDVRELLRLMISNPALLITVLLVMAVIFVNGWTETPYFPVSATYTKTTAILGAGATRRLSMVD